MTTEAPQPRRRMLPWIVSFIVASLTGFGILLGVGCAIGANSCLFGDEAPQEASLDGATIFARNCAACHGIEGTGDRGGPSLVTGSAASLDLEELEAKISRGRPFMGMPRFKGELSEEQITAVAGYVLGLRDTDASSPSPEESP